MLTLFITCEHQREVTSTQGVCNDHIATQRLIIGLGLQCALLFARPDHGGSCGLSMFNKGLSETAPRVATPK